MDGADWLRTQLTSFGCAACGQPYEAGTMRVLAEREGLFFVQLPCPGCGSQAIAIVTVEADDERGPRANAGELVSLARVADPDAAPAGAPPIGADDVLDVHAVLAAFQGDAHELLRRLGAPMHPGGR